MTSFFGMAAAVTALSPIIIAALLSIFFFGELPGIKICIVILVTSSYLAISHTLVKKIGLMKSLMIGLLAMILNFIILVA